MRRAADNCPIIIDGIGCLDYSHISKFMNTKQRVVKVKKELAAKYVVPSEVANMVEDSDGKVSVAVRCSDSVYTGIQSAVAYLYRQCGVERPDAIKSDVSLYCKGSKRMGKSLKQGLALKISEGKKAMSRAVFSYMARMMFISGEKEHIFSHLFLVLDW